MSLSPSSTSGTAPQMNCTVTNNLILPTHPSTSAQTGWNGEVVAISNTAGSTVAASMDNLQLPAATDFVQLNFGAETSTANNKTSASGNPLSVGKSASLTVPVITAPPNTSDNSLIYDLLFAQANNYFPVATIAGVVTSKDSADIVLPMAAPLDTSSAANAYQFLQAIMANPYSSMAQQFTAALSADINADPVTGSCANVNAFFAQTDNFKNVDFAIYSAVTSYAFAFATVWADFHPHFTYIIYTTTATDSTNDGDPSASNVKLSPIGTVVFSQIDHNTPPLADANAGYSILWKPNEGPAVDLNVVQGQLVSQTSSDGNAVCLQTTFAERALVSRNASSDKQVCQALIGLINGIHVVGSPLQLTSSDPEDGDQGEDGIPDNDAAVAENSLEDIVIMGLVITCVLTCVAALTYFKYRNRPVENARVMPPPEQNNGEDPPEQDNEDVPPLDQNIGDLPAPVQPNIMTTELNFGGFLARLQNAGFPNNPFAIPLNEANVPGNGNNSELLQRQVRQFEDSQIQQGDSLRQAQLENRQLSQEEEEEEDQLSVRSNSTIINEVNQSNEDELQLRNVDLDSNGASQVLNNIQADINSNQAEILRQNQILGLRASQQNQLENQIIQEQQEDQRIENEEADHGVRNVPEEN